jgi:iron complex outermembrane receptor protein
MEDGIMQTAHEQQGGQAVWQRRLLALATTLVAMTMMPVMSLAQSDTDDEYGPGLLEEIIVTAQRREQALQAVPMAISAFTGEQLAQLQADNLDSLQGAVPNLNLVQGRGSNSSVNVFIRGVGQPDALQSFDPAVGIYLDDVYISRIQGGLFKLYDIERIEVLRGPQGTLYGKNTPGGAIRLITRTPGQELEAQAGLLVGNYDRVQAKAYLSGPLSDNFALGLSVLHDERDGFVTDPSDGRKYNDEDTTVARLKGNWDISDSVNIVFSADYTKEDVELTLGRAEDALIGVDLLTGVVLRQLAPTEEWNFETRTSMTDAGGQKVDHYGGNITINWDFSGSTSLKSITAYRKLETESFIDIDATEWEVGDVFVGLDQKQFSQEFQLLGSSGGNVNWVAGLFYLNEEVPSDQIAFADDFLLFGGIPIDFTRTIADDLETKSYAAFGQIDYQFADRWNLGVGLRYTNEKKSYFRTTSTFSNFGFLQADPAYEFSDSDSWSDWTPTITLDYRMSDDVRFYGRLANGFKSGGFNGRANNEDDAGAFDPETVWTAEIGAKTTAAGGRLRANYALFMSKYDDFQARVSVADGIDFRFPVLNAAELDIKGAEVELTWLPVDPLQLATQIGYLKSDYGKGGFFGSDGIEDEPAFSPKLTARFAGTYTFDLSGGSQFSLTAAANYRDSMWLSVENVDPLTESDYWLLDGLVSWVSGNGNWTLTAGIKNATDEVYKVEGQEFRSVGNIQTAYYGNPRTYTFTVDFRY